MLRRDADKIEFKIDQWLMKRRASMRDAASKGIVVSCFDFTGNMVRSWAEDGYECHIVDMQHPRGRSQEGNITKWGMDVLEWEREFFKLYDASRVVVAAFFPPCTDLAVSGARWFADKESRVPGTRKRAMDLVYWSDRVGKRLGCPYFIENPVSVISTEWRKPDFVFNPFHFGGYQGGAKDGYKKTTCLWTGNGFVLPERKSIDLDPRIENKIHRMPPGPNRQNLRSQTPMGFARAIFEHYSAAPRA